MRNIGHLFLWSYSITSFFLTCLRFSVEVFSSGFKHSLLDGEGNLKTKEKATRLKKISISQDSWGLSKRYSSSKEFWWWGLADSRRPLSAAACKLGSELQWQTLGKYSLLPGWALPIATTEVTRTPETPMNLKAEPPCFSKQDMESITPKGCHLLLSLGWIQIHSPVRVMQHPYKYIILLVYLRYKHIWNDTHCS